MKRDVLSEIDEALARKCLGRGAGYPIHVSRDLLVKARQALAQARADADAEIKRLRDIALTERHLWKAFPTTLAKIAAQARADAIEECAKEVEGAPGYPTETIATAIRALKDKE